MRQERTLTMVKLSRRGVKFEMLVLVKTPIQSVSTFHTHE